jgi:hypothetical protein
MPKARPLSLRLPAELTARVEDCAKRLAGGKGGEQA